MTQRGREEEYGPESADYGLSYEPDPWAAPADEYGPQSADYGLSYEADPWADPVLDEQTGTYPGEPDPDEDYIEATWERGFRDGHITREEFHARRRTGFAPEQQAAPDAEPALRSAVEKLHAKLSSPDLTAEQRALDEGVLASLQEMLARNQTGRDDSSHAY
ncbi:hypothetical protein ACFWBI_22925 [Streptomyces sp. NPDC059982]|uniref:hypothetical protein n=1 Tax=unclassified Streptomyces TaxID=2593676 RepID=UPI0036B8B8D6